MAKASGSKTDTTSNIVAALKKRYPKVTCALDHKNAFELLAATILSAQCTDKRVNMVTPALFARYPTPTALAKARQSDVEELVKSTGFFRNKAKNLIGMALGLVENLGGQVPEDMDALVALPGVARKTANVVLGTAYGKAVGVVVDTHVSRITKLLGLTREDDAVKIERDLMQLLPQKEWIMFSHRLIHLGRDTCIANRPRCEQCVLADYCKSAFAAKTKASEKSGPETRSAS